MKVQTIHQHNCQYCTYLGPFEEKGTQYDLYWCDQGPTVSLPTVIARYGSDGPEFTSGLRLADDGPLLEAKNRAKALRLDVALTMHPMSCHECGYKPAPNQTQE